MTHTQISKNLTGYKTDLYNTLVMEVNDAQQLSSIVANDSTSERKQLFNKPAFKLLVLLIVLDGLILLGENQFLGER